MQIVPSSSYTSVRGHEKLYTCMRAQYEPNTVYIMLGTPPQSLKFRGSEGAKRQYHILDPSELVFCCAVRNRAGDQGSWLRYT